MPHDRFELLFSGCLLAGLLATVAPAADGLHVPDGFEVIRAAGPPLIERPIVADFDDQGRLYVAEALGSNDKIQVQLEKKPYRIFRLEDTDGDGRFNKRTAFVERIMFPEGALWYDGSLYVAAPPSIWKLTDTDNDGVADEQVEWFEGKTLTNCANDLHGPYLGPDGWIYWCKGAFARQTYTLPGGDSFTTRASHIFRCRPDGSGLEPVMTGGMDNPVDVVFTPGGERIFSTTFFQHPGGGQRDGLIHAVYGGIYGKDHSVIYEHPWTAPTLMPVLTHLGPAAPCGLHRLQSTAWGKTYANNVFCCLFNLHKVTRHVLEEQGASYRTQDEDFLVSDSLDFHPTDVLEDADGSLLVIDTGGWYKLCCPTSQLHKPDVLGAIYRIRKKDAPAVADPRGLKLPWDELSPAQLCGLLDDSRAVVRRRAMETLTRHGESAVEALQPLLADKKASPLARRNAVWTACRIDGEAARKLVRRGLSAQDADVKQAALHSISVRRDRQAVPALLQIVGSGAPHHRRAAAEALGRIGDQAAVPSLLAATADNPDRVLRHSLTYALIEIGDPQATAAGLKSENLQVQAAALTALDQMKSGKLSAQPVIARLTSPHEPLREIAWWIAGRHPEWGGELTNLFRQRVTASLGEAAERDLIERLGQFAGADSVQQLLAETLRNRREQPDAARRALAALASARLKRPADSLLAAVIELLRETSSPHMAQAVAAAQAFPAKPRSAELASALRNVAAREQLGDAVRLQALVAVPGGLQNVNGASFDFLLTQLAPSQPLSVRTGAADVLSQARLSDKQLIRLAENLPAAGPLVRDRMLDVFQRNKNGEVGRALAAALLEPTIRGGLRVEAMEKLFRPFGKSVQEEFAKLTAAIRADTAEQRAQLEEALATLEKGDIRRGQAVFQSRKAACIGCHAVGYLGGRVGPDLTRIGRIRTERDLLEAILFPSASFVRSYEPLLVITVQGKTYNGLLRKDSPDEVVLALDATKEIRIPRADIEEMQPGTVSVMPAGLNKQLSPQQLADLVAFLKSCR